MLQCFNSVSNNEADVKIYCFCPTATYKLLVYADILRCYGMTKFVDVCLARWMSHIDKHCRAKCQIARDFFPTNMISFY